MPKQWSRVTFPVLHVPPDLGVLGTYLLVSP
ncbi:uncharacterized protein FIBRA_09119 [Fibroporia radiculosa]|uniref:Uncharacterized protein n=1 Tax=Fibroporia radiculosa TaxID=599839 RepID=J4I3V0_9APHY|nr:uncharacterized protein FIBRA_09119 [Fibroporia radiculosa]CCM06817.1 predicted protein [Fibroporia radiculosa]